jgi:hypothetical protein
MLWLVETYVKASILDLVLVKPIMAVVTNIAEDEKSSFIIMGSFVLVAVWQYEGHHLIKETRKLDNAVLGLSKTSSIESS